MNVGRRLQIGWAGWRWWPLVRVWSWPHPGPSRQVMGVVFDGLLIGPLDFRFWREPMPRGPFEWEAGATKTEGKLGAAPSTGGQP